MCNMVADFYIKFQPCKFIITFVISALVYIRNIWLWFIITHNDIKYAPVYFKLIHLIWRIFDKSKKWNLDFTESTIMLSGSSQGESSVLRVRLRVVKNPLRKCTSPLQIHISRSECALAEVEYTSLPPSAYS